MYKILQFQGIPLLWRGILVRIDLLVSVMFNNKVLQLFHYDT